MGCGTTSIPAEEVAVGNPGKWAWWLGGEEGKWAWPGGEPGKWAWLGGEAEEADSGRCVRPWWPYRPAIPISPSKLRPS